MSDQGDGMANAPGYRGIAVLGDALCEVDSGRVMVRISTADVRGLKLLHGHVANHPVMQMIAGGVMVLIGGWPIIWLIEWAVHGGTIISSTMWMIGFAVVGVWLIIQAFREGHYLEVETTRGLRKLAFDGKVDESAASAFVGSLREALNLKSY